jgi:hypothetical protein
MGLIGRFFKIGIVVVALVICAMMALSAFSIRVPLSSVTTTTVGNTTITTKCSWLHATAKDWSGCTTTRTHRSK